MKKVFIRNEIFLWILCYSEILYSIGYLINKEVYIYNI